MRKRSVGVTIFAVLFIIGAVLTLVSLVTTPRALQMIVDTPGIAPEAKVQMETTLQLFQSRSWLIGLQALASLAAGIGLFLLQGWARWLTLIVAGLSIIQVVVSLFTQGGVGTGAAAAVAVVALLGSVGWSGFIIWFFLRSSVREQFQKG